MIALQSASRAHRARMTKMIVSHRTVYSIPVALLPLISFVASFHHHHQINIHTHHPPQGGLHLHQFATTSADDFVNFNGLQAFGGQPECPREVIGCEPYTKYRNYDGGCTNPFRPSWGVAGSNYIYLLRPQYDDGVQSPKVQVRNVSLPSPRVVKNAFFPDGDTPSRRHTLMVMAWGQFFTHDIANLRARNADRMSCCTSQGQYRPRVGRDCFPIQVPQDDPVMAYEGISCMNFSRIQSDIRTGCRVDKTEPIAMPLNEVTPAMDLSQVYAITADDALPLRTRRFGQFKTEFRNNFMYPEAEPGEDGCSVNYVLGDARANQNAPLTLLHIAFVNYHNILALKLSKLNPQWNDNKLFEETRRIMIAIFQYITFYEWLPIIMGKNNVLSSGIIHKTEEHVSDFNPLVNVAVTNEYSHAASRVLHNLIPDFFGLYSRERTLVSQIKLLDNFSCQQIMEVPGAVGQLAIGLVTQPMKQYSTLHAESITQGLFRNQGNTFGSDLRSLDLQRGRDVGLRPYVEYLKMCRFIDPNADPNDWSVLGTLLRGNDVDSLRRVYATPDAVDLSTGLGLEPRVSGAQLGPTSICIFTDQMLRLRTGDFRWFEHPEAGFTPAQVRAIKQVSLARLICESLRIEEIQPRPFFQIEFGQNDLQNCFDHKDFDLTPWINT